MDTPPRTLLIPSHLSLRELSLRFEPRFKKLPSLSPGDLRPVRQTSAAYVLILTPSVPCPPTLLRPSQTLAGCAQDIFDSQAQGRVQVTWVTLGSLFSQPAPEKQTPETHADLHVPRRDFLRGSGLQLYRKCSRLPRQGKPSPPHSSLAYHM